MAKTNKKKSGFWIVLALVFLFNANIRTIDLLPDFVAYIIILRMLNKVNIRAPYFQEAADAVKNLLIITLLKLPSQIFVSMVQSQNVKDNDIVVLCTLVFSILEVIFVLKAIKYIFDALFYVGQRTNASCLISQYNVTGKSTHSPEYLRGLTYVFFVAKNLLVFIPEMLLLTKTVEIGSQTPVFNPATMYSETLLLCVIIVTFLGIVWLTSSLKYLKNVRTSCNIYYEICSLADDQAKAEISIKEMIRSHSTAMKILILAAVLSIELVFDNFHNINLLPSFIFVSVLVLGNYMLHRRAAIKTIVVGVLFCVASVVSYASLISFLEKYSYESLAYSNEARAEYLRIIIISAIELVLFLINTIFNFINTRKYIYKNTGLSRNCKTYSTTDRKYHSGLIRKSLYYSLTSVIVVIAKFSNLLLKFTVKNLAIEMPDESTSMIITTALPWFNLVLFASSILFIGYSAYFFTTLKEEVELKYNCK